MDKQQFFNGAVFDAWRWFGAHLGGGGAVFRTFAPNASRITLTGAMNGWTETDLHQDGRSGFWEVSVPGTQAGQLYKYRIYAADLRLRHGDAPGVLLDRDRPRGIPVHG